ncbi:CDP-alcohol phosphatidyltransferase [Sulfodiicoccus acidiphilus]|uniref:CDP-alcohol phosphatidyltransferase n=1 Tax=Sulfodiicoccus acidiphilus TaxID=1670455 RepID=A0A348B0S2_9CREN|nr:archaetidylinositol phosphate synthase [Sulfodiicoccus acidiphilus]BBD71774.1 CDP-alcohol phosphatidyltransferase [Sulfodiicoccus acidiphilus]GGT99126.1 CDP-alcohol phosphatidyltransferase [Sulfodiicoccus acidiphilus]
MFENLREATKRLVSPVAKTLVKLGLTANQVTLLGLVFSFLYLVLLYFNFYLIAVAFLVSSALMDAFDGEVARMRGTSGPAGAFIDSNLDRIEDLVYLLGFLVLGYPPLAVSITIGSALITSYVRAKAEALGQVMRGRGIIERGDRLLFIFLILIVGSFQKTVAIYIFYVFTLLSAITVIQRIFIGYKAIR